ncbi:response regulator transcription factor [Paenibacillus sedimenti]|uniref:Response regulator n=1 Tax=Paenibacillus sedimenti TaxID=2770274 RepID=A0A926KJ62_9BACL|nr:response regulator [Paenibacillus sedimenti]MBD0378707.1 response regulator [Paenibacillus sedimenti]
MYRLLIVEDEEIFRTVLPTIIDWNSIGFEVAGVCENGYKALEFLDKTEVDAILTDIRMPVLNGLELAMEVKSKFPKTKVTLFSAFNEFDYARKGLECGVYGYILKSDGEDEIVHHFTKLKDVLDKENQIRMDSEDIWRQREILFKEIMESNSNTNEKAVTNIQKAGVFVKNKDYRITLFRLDEYKHLTFYSGADRVRSIHEFIRGYLYEHIEIQNKGTVISLNEMFCVLWTLPEKDFVQTVTEVFSNLKEELGMYKKNEDECLDISCVIGNTTANLQELCHSYLHIREAFLHKAYIGNCMINESELDPNSKRIFTFMEEERLMKEIMPLVNGKAHVKLIEYLDTLKNQLIDSKLTDIDMISGFAVKLVLSIVGELGQMGKKSDVFLEKSNYAIKEIGYCETIVMIFKKLEAFTVEAFDLLNEESPMKNRRIVDEALAYIRKNYSGQISLEELARHVNVHPVHVSRLFSKDLGQTFKHILTEVRIEEAKRLLKDINYRVYEISSLVGYEKPRYFSELFRSVTGLTPLEYREKYKG